AGRAEARIQAPVGVVAREREGGAAALVRVSRGDELPVGLQDEGEDLVVDTAEGGGGLPRRAEARIQAAGGQVARERELCPASCEGVARRDELAVGLKDE